MFVAVDHLRWKAAIATWSHCTCLVRFDDRQITFPTGGFLMFTGPPFFFRGIL
jgi:hypothetical protein